MQQNLIGSTYFISLYHILLKQKNNNQHVSVVGTLKRTMSLGRLTRKRNRAQQKLEQTENPCGDPHHCSFTYLFVSSALSLMENYDNDAIVPKTCFKIAYTAT
ncbi:hypothetical protein KUTeg_001170 [Tegillarca granosa]|uniref:Uncharacterized protein n=1 Tax=Tegillarca granosa TaxID=220873 RepID=A0ABQ9FZ81_TEGGR|nr:hypothetical protein KUTeg_001170 [Tegillarca granosa]